MDLEDIAKLVEMFKRSRVEEDDKVIIDSEMVRSGLDRMEMCLLAKVFSSRPIPRDIFKQQMPKILQTSKSVEVEAVRENLFVLEFRSAIDRRRTLLEGPWNIFRNLVVFQEIKGLQNLLEIPFEHVDIWVQLYNLPFAFMNRRVLESIGAKVGVVLEVDEGDGGNYWGQYARIRARIDLSKPLKKCVTVKVEGEAEEEIVIVLIYERLPDFCYGCGRMGHTMKECRSKDLVDDDRENPPYGPWLKAATSPGDGDPAEIEEKVEVRKEKKGDRISALQQLVAPFGKTDTASVLSEAIGYIRFLQGQIEALSTPYMRNAPANSVQERNCLYPEEAAATGQDTVNNLRSRGLCLVPISCTEKVGNDNGADYWGPAALGGGWVLIDLQAHDGD